MDERHLKIQKRDTWARTARSLGLTCLNSLTRKAGSNQSSVRDLAWGTRSSKSRNLLPAVIRDLARHCSRCWVSFPPNGAAEGAGEGPPPPLWARTVSPLKHRLSSWAARFVKLTSPLMAQSTAGGQRHNPHHDGSSPIAADLASGEVRGIRAATERIAADWDVQRGSARHRRFLASSGCRQTRCKAKSGSRFWHELSFSCEPAQRVKRKQICVRNRYILLIEWSLSFFYIALKVSVMTVFTILHIQKLFVIEIDRRIK